MIGCHNGVAPHLKRSVPSTIGVHCATHRRNLASSQADMVPYVTKFNNFLLQLFDYLKILMLVWQVYKLLKLVHENGKPLVSYSTRWLSTERSMQVEVLLCICCSELEREGEEWSDAKAVGLNRFSTEHRFVVCTMLLLCDALRHVTHLSKCFQIAYCCDYSIIPRITSLLFYYLQFHNV